ncbi:MAG TPA: amino acid ABC transporter permease [Nocardioidaceae bacterium]|nr:amino acid ABC transporter permease [Nocardioidaceae bacterium]
MSETTVGGPVEIKAVPVRHPGRWVATLVVLVLLAMLVHSLLTNPNFGWDVVFRYFTFRSILVGLSHTVLLTVLCMAIGVVGGVILAVMRLSPNPVLTSVSWLYIWFFRGTPLLVQILFWGYIGALFETVGFGVPFGPEFVTFKTQSLISVFLAAVLGLALNEAAYMAEIVRAGILSIDAGQTEAAQSVGMSRLLTMRRIVLPQAMRVIIPPTGNEFINMLKTSSLAFAIGYQELFLASRNFGSRTLAVMEALIVATILYLVLTTIFSIFQYYIERHFSRGSSRQMPDTPVQRAWKHLTTFRHGTGSGARL